MRIWLLFLSIKNGFSSQRDGELSPWADGYLHDFMYSKVEPQTDS